MLIYNISEFGDKKRIVIYIVSELRTKQSLYLFSMSELGTNKNILIYDISGPSNPSNSCWGDREVHVHYHGIKKLCKNPVGKPY